MSASLETSDCTASKPLPSEAVASSSVFWLRPLMATRAPSSCNRFAVARPMPLLPPVITATFPSSRFILKNSSFLGRRPVANAARRRAVDYQQLEPTGLDDRLNDWLRAFRRAILEMILIAEVL